MRAKRTHLRSKNYDAEKKLDLWGHQSSIHSLGSKVILALHGFAAILQSEECRICHVVFISEAIGSFYCI